MAYQLLTLTQFSTAMNSFATKCDARFLQISNAGALATKDKVALADFDTDATAKITALDTLIGSDTAKSARTIAAEELAAQLIPSTAKEALDTLQEIAAWIQDHPDEAAAINAKLTLGTYEDETSHEQVQYATVKAYVEAYVAAQITSAGLSGSDAISITNQAVSLIIDTANANGLAITSSGLKLNTVVASASGTGGSNGAMTAAQAEKLAGLENTTAGNGIDITDHVASIALDSSNARGLSVGASGLALAAATPDTYSGDTKTDGTAGAMTSADKYKLDSIVFATDQEVAAVITAIWAS